jgi:hypothetical protein
VRAPRMLMVCSCKEAAREVPSVGEFKVKCARENPQ